MACIFRGQGSAIARALLLALLFVAFGSPAALAQLYEQPVLVIDPGMHTAPIKSLGADVAGRFAVTGSDDKTVRVWSISDGKLLQTIRMPAGPGNVDQAAPVDLAHCHSDAARDAQEASRFHRRAKQQVKRLAALILEHQQGSTTLAYELKRSRRPGFIQLTSQSEFMSEAIESGGGWTLLGRNHGQDSGMVGTGGPGPSAEDSILVLPQHLEVIIPVCAERN